MINLIRNQDNRIVLTLSELTDSSSNVFFIEFTNEMTQKKTTFEVVDLSLFPERYNLFILTLGQVNELIGNGFYVYSVKQSDKIIERGLAFIHENDNNNAFYNANYINKEYGN
jgi:hypothetical protein